ncbi:MAG: orotidine 5'-phosphate decarboxylase / HUMPS family protein [Candidatus Heimdallarchaeota archaeon]
MAANYQRDFLRKYEKAKEEKNSILCAGFDPAIPGQRKENVVPAKFLEKKTLEEGILSFFEEFLERVQDYCCAIKPNNQYLFYLSLNAYQKLNRKIHDYGLVSILDQKIGDIGSTNDAGFYWMKKMGFDAVTHSPFAGNIKESITAAHAEGLGLITLTLMSNPDAIYFMKEATLEGLKGYEFIAKKVGEYQGDGVVVGATGHVTKEDISTIRKLAGDETIMLVPGIGKQQGDLEKIINFGGTNILLNVSRAIMYAKDIGKAAETYNQKFNEVRKRKKEK